MTPMTVGSLFAGIGGFDLAAEWCGLTVKWQCEVDPYCRAVLQKHWPDVPRYGDIRKVQELPYVDIITGGFPCQDISNNGDCTGLDGVQSKLWQQMVRTIGMVGPKWVIVENVAALIYRGLGQVIGDLATLGYDAEWGVLSAAAFGAPHERERIFIIGHRQWTPVKYAAGLRECSCCAEPWCEDCETHFSECWCPGPHSTDADGWDIRETPWRLVAYPTGRRVEGHGTTWKPESLAPAGPVVFGRSHTGSGTDQWDLEPDVARMVYGVPIDVDRVRSLGNAVIPQIAEWVFRQVITAEEDRRGW